MKRSLASSPCVAALIAVTPLATALGAPLPGSATSPATPVCEVQAEPNTVRIDAETGRFHPEDDVYYPLGTQVTLVFYNRNPFRYSYEYVITETNLEADVIKDGLKLLGFPKPDDQAEPQGAPPPAPEDAKCKQGGKLQEACKAEKEAGRMFQSARNELSNAKNKYAKAKARVDAFERKAGGKMDSRLCQDLTADLPARISDLKVLVETSNKAKAILSKIEVAEHHRNQAEKLRLQVDCSRHAQSDDCSKLSDAQAIKKCKETNEANKKDCETDKLNIENGLKNLKSNLAPLSSEANQWKQETSAAAAAYNTLLGRYKEIEESNNAFVDRRNLARRRSPTRYKITIQPTHLADTSKTDEISVGEIDIGKSRFSISAGLGISFVTDREFGRQSGLVATGENTQSVSDVFAVTSESSEDVGFVFQLNGRLGGGKKWGFHWSLGSGAGISGQEDSELSFFTGPSVSFIDDQLFFTFAYHERTTKELGNGFAVDQPIPEEVQDPLPLREVDEGALLFTVTYRFK